MKIIYNFVFLIGFNVLLYYLLFFEGYLLKCPKPARAKYTQQPIECKKKHYNVTFYFFMN